MATDRFISTAQWGGQGGPQPAQPPGTFADSPGAYDDPGYGADAALDAFTGQPSVQAPVNPAELHVHDVTAVLVAHNGSRWLPRVLESLAAMTYRPDRIFAVDTGSSDDTNQMLTSVLGAPSVITAPKSTGFGAAVALGVQEADDVISSSTQGAWPAERTEWIWLLHDDSAPAPDALQRLLETAVRRPDAGVIGPKVLSWRGDRQLLEVGLTVTGGGRRHTGLDRKEYDQGQHDTTRDVLAVGSAGMLVRRDVWDELGGFDPVLSVFRDDIDFGWRANQADYAVVLSPDAVVHHAEAAAHGRRRLGATRHRAHLADRRNALYVLLANSPARLLPLLFLRVLLGGLGRSLSFLVGKQPALAVEELGAVLAVLGRPDRLIRGRARRRAGRRRSHAAMRPLFLPRGQRLRNAVENVLGVLTGSGSGHDVPGAQRRAETTDEDVPATDDTFLLRLLLHPLVLAVGALTLITVVAVRDLIGGGHLIGGALLPVVDEPGTLWQMYTESWHGVGLGSPTPAPPYLAAVAIVASIVRSATLAVDLLILAAVPLAGMTMYVLLRRLVRGRWLRLWGSVTYALLPATTGAIAAGRLGTVVAAVLSPLLVLALYRTLGRPGAPGPFRAAWSAGLILAVITAFVPLAWIITLLVAVVGVAAMYRNRESVWRMGVALAVPPVLLVPWSGTLLGSPGLLFTEAGMPGPDLSDDALEPWAVLFQAPGGPGGAPVWLGAGLLLAGWAALFRPDRRLLVHAAWAIAGVGLMVGLLVSRLPVTGPTLHAPVSGWPGYATVVIGGCLIIAAVVGGEGAREWLSRSSFGWRQPLVALATAGAVLVPVIGAGWWVVRGADEPLERRDPRVLPAYISDEAQQPERIRTLVLSRRDDGRVTYALLRSSGPRLGDAETGPPPDEHQALDEVVADLVSGRGGADGARLAEFATRYVYLAAPYDRDLANTLDTVPGLVRASAPEGAAMWRVDQASGRAWIAEPVSEDGAAEVPEEPVILDSGAINVRTSVPDGPDGRVLVLAELADSGWSATLDGRPLESVVHDDWAQGFVLGPDGGELVLTHQGTRRAGVLLIQLGLVILVAILALPGMRREKGAVDDASQLDPEEPTSPELPVVPDEPSPVAVPAGATADESAPAASPAYSQAGEAAPTAGYAAPDHQSPGYRRAPDHQSAGSWPADGPRPGPAGPESAWDEPDGPVPSQDPGTEVEADTGHGGSQYRGKRARRRSDGSADRQDGQPYRGRRAAGRRAAGRRARDDGKGDR